LIEFTKDRLGHDYRYSLNSDKIKEQIGWKASVRFDDGIEKTVKWYLDNMEWVKGKLNNLKKYWDLVYKK
jgi:dTDP-glucose 4,6-dehydratase